MNTTSSYTFRFPKPPNLRFLFGALILYTGSNRIFTFIIIALFSLHNCVLFAGKGENPNPRLDVPPINFTPASVTNGSLRSSVVSIPTITTRFSNPQFNCITEEYCVDVEFQSDLPDQELFGMNVRFFYEDLVLEFVNFRDFQGGYEPVEPNPAEVITSPPHVGYDYFGFGEPGNGPADFVNGAIQLVDQGAPPIYISTTEWTKLFQICFTIDDANPDSTGFCPPLVWDLRQDPADGGYLAGDDGVVILVWDEVAGITAPASEQVVQFNWEYTGDGSAAPFGAPTETDCIPFSCGLDIVCPADLIMDCGESTLPAHTGLATSDDQCPGLPVITYVDSLVSVSCGPDYQILRTWTVSDSCANVSTCQQIITVNERGMICGSVLNDEGDIMPGIALNLIADINGNQFIDPGDTVYMVTYTDTMTGSFCFTSVEPCAYIIEVIAPLYYEPLSDFDVTPDPDGDDSGLGPNRLIPVEVSPCESDHDNNFVLVECPGIVPLLPLDTICENDSLIFLMEDLGIGLLTYTWDFGSGSTPSTGIGLGPHNVTYVATPENQAGGAEVNLTIAKSGCADTTLQITEIDINPFADASIDGSTAPGCYFTDRIYKPLQAEIPGATYTWSFGYGAHPATAAGYGPHTVYYDTAGVKSVSLAVYPNAPGAQCPDSSMISFTINSCPGSILGSVLSESGAGIGSVNLKLFADADTNGIADDNVAIKNVFTNSAGTFVMASLVPGHYVIEQVQPNGWFSIDDGDLSDDGDAVLNVSGLDNLIPVTLYPAEVDMDNYFKEGPVPGLITGSVFVDFNSNQFPDSGEGIANVSIQLFSDADIDGVADSIIPITSQITMADGSYTFTNVPVGHYVIVETQPAEYENVKDFDASNDNDVVPNTNMFNDTIPVTLTNQETDAHNYFINAESCNLMVTNTNDEGTGSLRATIDCAENGDTILFHATLSGETITITSNPILIEKNIVIYGAHIPRVTLASQVAGFFDIAGLAEVKFKQVDIISGLSCGDGAALNNDGILRLENVTIRRNEFLPPADYLLHNRNGGEMIFEGNCFIEEN